MTGTGSSLNKQESTLILAGNNSYSGNSVVNNGILQLQHRRRPQWPPQPMLQ